MNLFSFCRIAAALYAGAVSIMCLATPPENSTYKEFDKFFSASHNNHASVVSSVQVVRLSDGATLYEREASRLMVPASVTKLAAAGAALHYFGPAHTFSTKLYHTGTIASDGRATGTTIKGDLIVVGDGDPYLVSELLWQLVADLRHLGLTKIDGDIVLDNSLFDDTARDASRASSRQSSTHAYDAPISAFGVNFNTYAVAITPSPKVGEKALVHLDPYNLDSVTIINHVTTSKQKTDYSVTRQSGKDGQEVLIARGQVAVNKGLAKVYRSVTSWKTSGDILKAFLVQGGIAVTGSVRAGTKPTGAKDLMNLRGYDMRRIVTGLNVFSNNYIADVLLKRLGAEHPIHGKANTAGSGTYANGLHAISAFLKEQVGIRTPFTIKNASGLSTDNRLSANQVVQLLSYMERRMDLYPDFLASLPASGLDGTLKKRFKSTEVHLAGMVRAKTGTLSQPISVSGIAGYFRHPKHGMMAFCVMENGTPKKKQPAISALRDRQDRFLSLLLEDT